MFELRPYQESSIEGLREGFKQGHVRQVLAAATGAGKSIMALSILDAARKKGSKTMFVCDRRVLVDQFSRHLDRHGMDHGVYMAGHWRYRPYENVQVASIQTIEKMGSWPAVDLIIVDEIHAVMRKSLKSYIKGNPSVKILGLTATPYHPELGGYFTSITNVVSMEQLVQEGFLVPYRVFVATEIDTTGVKVTAGEWQKDELEKRGLMIVGDVVADYVRIAHEVWGEPRKTIVFSSGVAHGTELVKRFAEVGLNFVQISYLDDEEYKQQVLEDFAKPDTDIIGVISSDILTRGFDNTGVEHVVIAKPLRKAFSMHVQMVGRGARPHPDKKFCIASGQRVLTQRGLVPIEKVLLSDRLWDGQSFVSHGGVISKGFQDVITYAGLTATPDHLVKTKEGWRPFGECAAQQIPIVQTGLGGVAIWESEDCFARDGLARGKVEAPHVRALRVPNLFQQILDQLQQLVPWNRRRLQEVQSAKGCGTQGCASQGCGTASTLHEPKEHSVSGLWWSRHRVQVLKCFGWLSVGHGKPAATREFEGLSIGQDRQRGSLRARKSSLVNSIIQLVAHAKANASRQIARFSFGQPGYSLCGPNTEASFQYRSYGRANQGEVLQAELQTKRQVWDILNSGPRNCFTCEDLLVHNCVIQDNAGNWLRFREDWDELFHEGTKSLDANKDKKARKEKTQKEKEASKCPKCSALWPSGSDTCVQCGHVRQRTSKVGSLPGTMEELAMTGKHSWESKQDWWSMCQYKVRYAGWNPGRAAHTYKDRFGIWPRGLDDTKIKTPSIEFEKAVKAALIRYLKGKKSA